MKRHLSKSSRHGILIVLGAIAAAFLAVLITLIRYSITMENTLVSINSDALEETYSEVAQTFTATAQSRWNYLHVLGKYLQAATLNGSDIADDLEQMRSRYSFTEFYLLAEDGDYLTLDGQTGNLNLGANMQRLSAGEDIVTDGSLSGSEHMIFFAVPVAQDTYNGFSYQALAFGYDHNAMAEILQVRAYDGKSTAYIAYTTGQIAIHMGDDDYDVTNILSTLSECGFSSSALSTVRFDFEHQLTNTVLVDLASGESYVSYQPIGFQDWMLVSITPVSVANRSMEDIQDKTTRTIALVVSLIAACVLGSVLYWFRIIMRQKNGMLAERDLIFSLMTENMDEIYMLFRRDSGDVLYVSPNIERLLGISAREVFRDYNVLMQCGGVDGHVPVSDYMGLVPGENFRREVHLKNVYTGKMALYSFEVFRPEGDNSDMLIVVISDRTKEQAVRQEIEDALRAAQLANQSKSAFLSSVSHDIRTPMNAIVGFATLIERDVNDPQKVLNHVKKVQASSHHLLNLINDVLDISKIEAGKTTLKLEEVNIDTIIGRIDSIIRPQAIENGQTLIIENDLFAPCIVMADELRLTQILINILSNAIKYTPHGGHIKMLTENTAPDQSHFVRYHFTISDNGIGMSEAFVKTVFQPFTREVASTTNRVQGTGLGMAITKNLIDLMGGSVQVRSKKGEGSVFSVTVGFRLVRLLDEEKPAEDESLPLLPDSTEALNGLHILAAEDNELNAEILSELLDIKGATCDIVENGKLAVEAFEKSAPDQYDLILLDVQMPVMNGYDAAIAIRSCGHVRADTIPIVAMTANAFAEDVQNALASGMDAHVAKPLDINHLAETVHELLARGSTASAAPPEHQS